ncbi:MAG: 6-pyruvoyl tetrahydropterin synthase family protein, partial [Nitrospinota bacterium]
MAVEREPMYQVMVGGSFRASHFINFPEGPEPLHEHDFRVQLFVRGRELDETGFLLDFLYLRRVLEEMLKPLRGA